MPLPNPFKKPLEETKSSSPPSPLTPDIFPAPETTYWLASILLHNRHPDLFEYLREADAQQYLTEIYGCEPSLHWTWIACSFPPDKIKRQISYLSSGGEHGMGFLQRRRLIAFVKRAYEEEGRRRERGQKELGGEEFAEVERVRKEKEVEALEGIMKERIRKTPVHGWAIPTELGAIGFVD
ncbi:MAG: hypothetical protein Q9219_001418 [cf. Caloplaca sp. 3 TL-2023]